MRSEQDMKLLLDQMRNKKKRLQKEFDKYGSKREKDQIKQIDMQILLLEWIFEKNRLFDKLYQLRFGR